MATKCWPRANFLICVLWLQSLMKVACLGGCFSRAQWRCSEVGAGPEWMCPDGDYSTLSQSHYTALTTGICLPPGRCRGTVSGLWKTMEISTGHLSPSMHRMWGIPRSILRSTNPAASKTINWKPCLIPQRQSYWHQARTVKQSGWLHTRQGSVTTPHKYSVNCNGTWCDSLHKT